MVIRPDNNSMTVAALQLAEEVKQWVNQVRHEAESASHTGVTGVTGVKGVKGVTVWSYSTF